MSLLIVGGTGTLGRQIVLKALTKGYQVRCLVRNFRKANFLKEWGAELVYGDLIKPETIPPCLKGITAIIDASTNRPDDLNSLRTVNLEGKISLIQAAKIAKIQRFIYFSVPNAEDFFNIPLMKTTYDIELFLEDSDLSYTIFRLTGFYQGLLEQYAIPILDNSTVWITNEKNGVAYMSTQDIAKFILRSLQLPRTENKNFLLSGIKNWSSLEIVTLCEQFIGQSAKLNSISPFILKFLSNFFGFFEWSENISDRLAFVDILNREIFVLQKAKRKVYKIFKVETIEILQLDDYFLGYFILLVKRLRDINFEDVQKQKNLIL